jgi:hypothetical protein
MFAAALSACEAGSSVGTTGVVATAGGCARKSTALGAGFDGAPMFTFAPYAHRRSAPGKMPFLARTFGARLPLTFSQLASTPLGLQFHETVQSTLAKI